MFFMTSIIYINKVAVCVFVFPENFPFTIVMITKVFVQTFTTRGKTTNSITYFCVTISQVLYHQGKTTMALLFQYPNSNKMAHGATEVLVLKYFEFTCKAVSCLRIWLSSNFSVPTSDCSWPKIALSLYIFLISVSVVFTCPAIIDK